MKYSHMKRLKYIFLTLLMAGAIFLFNRFNIKEGTTNNITIAFYNVENLFDTKDDPHSNDAEFLPSNQWTEARYRKKLQRLSEVISTIGDQDGPELLGLGEVENAEVIKDLLKTQELKDRKYKFIHKDCKDKRGIDVALIYKPAYFTPFSTTAFKVEIPERRRFNTRDILVVGGLMNKDSVFLLVNHWPSRLGGQEESEVLRMAVAEKNRKLIDSLKRAYQNVKFVLMGDFNDEPQNKSISEVLGAKGTDGSMLYNPFEKLQKEGEGSIKYKSKWFLIDQIIISKSFLNSSSHKYIEESANVYHPVWMHYKEDPEKGPFRTFVGEKYYGGYSDHFPVYIQLAPN